MEMKIGYIKGVNDYEDQMMQSVMGYAYTHGENHLGLMLQVAVSDLGLAKDSQAASLQSEENDAYQMVITDRFHQAIQDFSAKAGMAAIIVPYGAQQGFSQDCVPETSCPVISSFYGYIKDKNERLDQIGYSCYGAEHVLAKTRLFTEPRIRRSSHLRGLGVIGLSRPAEDFLGSDCLTERLKGAYQLVTPVARQEVWQYLDQAFYDPEFTDNETLREYCSETVNEMQNFYRAYYDRDGLNAIVVTDFWTEQHLSTTPLQPHQLIGQTQLPNGTTLPLLNLERFEAWALIDRLVQIRQLGHRLRLFYSLAD